MADYYGSSEGRALEWSHTLVETTEYVYHFNLQWLTPYIHPIGPSHSQWKTAAVFGFWSHR